MASVVRPTASISAWLLRKVVVLHLIDHEAFELQAIILPTFNIEPKYSAGFKFLGIWKSYLIGSGGEVEICEIRVVD